MSKAPKIDVYYRKDDHNYIVIRSFKADKYDREYYNAKRKYILYTGNEIWGFTFYTRRYSLSEARKAVRNYLM